jgi:NhaA family Na+:H+ antiporter
MCAGVPGSLVGVDRSVLHAMTSRPATHRPTFLRSDRPLARAMQPLVRFLHVEAASAIVLLVATATALVWANSRWQDGYESFWSTTVHIQVGSYVFDEDLAHVVNDALMALFFFVVGMEIKRELVVGDLRDRRVVALPAFAALGGMLLPALIYAAFNAGGAGADGWGIPMATDIAFAMGVAAVLGSRVPSPVKLLLLTLAIVDDIGAIAVIAVFYTDDLRPRMLLVAAALTVLVWAMYRVNVTLVVLFVVAGIALWLAVYESGVHATIAGVALGLVTPALPTHGELVGDATTTPTGSASPCDRLIDAFHPWTSYVVLPIFALANAGIPLSMETLRDPSDVLLGVAVGLVVGKLVGVVSFSWLAVRLGLGRLPPGTRWGHIVGLGAVAGIGFTVSLFVAGLAFDPGPLQDDAKMGVLVASGFAAALATLAFSVASRRRAPESDG